MTFAGLTKEAQGPLLKGSRRVCPIIRELKGLSAPAPPPAESRLGETPGEDEGVTCRVTS